MPIRFHCPYCGWTTDVADHYLGQSGECVACGKLIVVPSASDEKPSERRCRGAPALWAGLLALVLLVGVLLFGVMAYVVLKPAGVPLFDRKADATACAANLNRVGAAIIAFAADQGHFPPAYTTDEDGAPLHSWRVLILPYLGYGTLHEQLKLDEPWNSEHNIRFTNQMPKEYGCPADTQTTDTETNYFVVQGPRGFLFHADVTTAPHEIADGAAQTLLVVEATNLGVLWMQPTDIESPDLNWSIATGFRNIGSLHEDGRYHLLTADGQVNALDANTPPDELQAMATIAGGETVTPVLSPP